MRQMKLEATSNLPRVTQLVKNSYNLNPVLFDFKDRGSRHCICVSSLLQQIPANSVA